MPRRGERLDKGQNPSYLQLCRTKYSSDDFDQGEEKTSTIKELHMVVKLQIQELTKQLESMQAQLKQR